MRPARATPEAVVAFLLLVCAPACRVGPPVADALVSPYPDTAGDTTTDGDGPAAPCDLLLQDCASRKTCYPADADTARDAAVRNGATTCELTGSAPPGSFCTMSLECDAREACVFVEESQATLCATLCDPTKAQTGCQRGAACRGLAGYRAGFCVL